MFAGFQLVLDVQYRTCNVFDLVDCVLYIVTGLGLNVAMMTASLDSISASLLAQLTERFCR